MEVSSSNNTSSAMYALSDLNQKDKKALDNFKSTLSENSNPQQQTEQLQTESEYRVTSSRIEEKQREIEQLNKKIEITETTKTVEKSRVDVLV